MRSKSQQEWQALASTEEDAIRSKEVLKRTKWQSVCHNYFASGPEVMCRNATLQAETGASMDGVLCVNAPVALSTLLTVRLKARGHSLNYCKNGGGFKVSN